MKAVDTVNVDDDYALALRLDQEQKDEDEDRKMAQRLQEEEDLRANQLRRRPSNPSNYRNASFNGFSSMSGDHVDRASAQHIPFRQSIRRRLSATADSMDAASGSAPWTNHQHFYPEPNDSAEEGLSLCVCWRRCHDPKCKLLCH